ncbi:protein of unknown function [Thauera humireducens]|nr:protein of unknown function [Thauera humireducens]
MHSNSIFVSTRIAVSISVNRILINKMRSTLEILEERFGSMPFPVEIDFSTNMTLGGTTARH